MKVALSHTDTHQLTMQHYVCICKYIHIYIDMDDHIDLESLSLYISISLPIHLFVYLVYSTLIESKSNLV